MKTRASKTGFSLVELLIVLAIIAILAGISIPLFARSAFLQDSDLQNGSRELYAMLRAAKIYAVDHHVDTAVVYNLTRKADSLDNDNLLTVGVGMFVARGLSPKERRALDYTEDEARYIFVRVRDSEGEYNAMTDGTCVLNIADKGLTEWVSGITWVNVHESGDDGLQAKLEAPWLMDPNVPPDPNLPTDPLLFPAHIFTSSGTMVSSRQISTQSIQLMVAPIPTADPQERANYDASGEIVYVDSKEDADTDPDHPDYRYIGVEIKPTLGRVKIASDEDYT